MSASVQSLGLGRDRFKRPLDLERELELRRQRGSCVLGRVVGSVRSDVERIKVLVVGALQCQWRCLWSDLPTRGVKAVSFPW